MLSVKFNQYSKLLRKVTIIKALSSTTKNIHPHNVRKALIPLAVRDPHRIPYDFILPKYLLPIRELSSSKADDKTEINLILPVLHLTLSQVLSSSTIEKVGIIVSRNQLSDVRKYLHNVRFCYDTHRIIFDDTLHPQVTKITHTKTSYEMEMEKEHELADTIMSYLHGRIELIIQDRHHISTSHSSPSTPLELSDAILAAEPFIDTNHNECFMVVLAHDRLYSPTTMQSILNSWYSLLPPPQQSSPQSQAAHVSEIARNASPTDWSMAGAALVALTGASCCRLEEVTHNTLLSISESDAQPLHNNNNNNTTTTTSASKTTGEQQHSTTTTVLQLGKNVAYEVNNMVTYPNLQEAKQYFTLPYALPCDINNINNTNTNTAVKSKESSTSNSLYLSQIGIDIFHSNIFHMLRESQKEKYAYQGQYMTSQHLDKYKSKSTESEAAVTTGTGTAEDRSEGESEPVIDIVWTSAMRKIQQQGCLYTSIVDGKKYDLGAPGTYICKV